MDKNITVIPSFSVNYMEFENWIVNDTDGFIEKLEELRIALKKASGYKWDNSIQRLSNIFGDEFKFHLYKKNSYVSKEYYYNLVIWDYTGNTSIGEFNFFPTDNKKEIVNRAIKLTEGFSSGYVVCSGCGSKQIYENIKRNKYFAGIYCQHCWDTKWKAIEAKEKYN